LIHLQNPEARAPIARASGILNMIELTPATYLLIGLTSSDRRANETKAAKVISCNET